MTSIIIITVGILVVAAVIIFLMPSDEGKSTQTISSENTFNKPGPNKRVCAYFIDLFFFFVLKWAIGLIFRMESNWILISIYWLLRDSFNGQSFGKFLVGLQVVNKEGDVIDFVEGIIRNITMAIPFVCVIEYIVMLKDNQGKRIGDKIAHTKVNDRRPHLSDGIFLLISICFFVVSLIFMYPSFNKKELFKSSPAVGTAGPSFDGRKWIVGHEDGNNEQTMTEHVLDGESVEDWSEMVTVEEYFGMQDQVTSKQFMKFMVDKVAVVCPGISVGINRESDREIIYDWEVINCANIGNQYEIARIVFAQDRIFVMRYSTKFRLSDEQFVHWVNIIESTLFGGTSEYDGFYEENSYLSEPGK
jgi:uncharacterized RDD family membrane protein YckC